MSSSSPPFNVCHQNRKKSCVLEKQKTNFKCIKDVYEIRANGVWRFCHVLSFLSVRIRVNFNFDMIEKLIFISGVGFF